MLSLINETEVLICAGTGGVGKTTIAASVARAAAESGRKVLVLTIDPAKRLADALHIKMTGEEAEVVVSGSGSLHAAIIDSEKVFLDFVNQHSHKSEAAERLKNNRLFKQMISTLSGSQEFTALERLLQAKESGRFDLIVLDTPPAQHAVDFLDAPEKIFSLFQDSITKWFINNQNSGVLQSLFNRGTQTVVQLFEKITGSGFLKELTDFFQAASGIQNQISSRSIQVHRLLNHKTTGFILVTNSDEAKLKESMEFALKLKQGGYFLKAIIMNRSTPTWAHPSEWEKVKVELSRSESVDYLSWIHYYQNRDSQHLKTLAKQDSKIQIIRIPEQSYIMDEMEAFKYFSQHLSNKT